jgi:hypothetical protein
MTIPAMWAGYSSALDRALDTREIRLTYQGLVGPGTQSVLSVAQAGASSRQFLLLGNASAGLSLASAQKIVGVSNESSITGSLNSNQNNLAIGMVTYFTAVPSAADGAYCYGFAIGGLQCSDVQNAVLKNYKRTSTVGVNYTNDIININGSTPIGGFTLTQPGNNQIISLNGSNQILLQDGSTALAYGTHTLVVCPAYGVIFGALNITDVADVAGANDILELVVRFV